MNVATRELDALVAARAREPARGAWARTRTTAAWWSARSGPRPRRSPRQLADGTQRGARAGPPRRRVRGLRRGREAAARATSSRSTTATAGTLTIDDPYRFLPTIGELDLHLLGEGRHEELWERLGAHVREHRGRAPARRSRSGRRPRARSSRGRRLQLLGRARCTRCARSARAASGSCSCPASAPGARYKYEILGAGRRAAAEGRPGRVRRPRCRRRRPRSCTSPQHEWARRGVARAARRKAEPLGGPMSIYEVHLGSWRLNPLEGNRSLTYLELADELVGLRERHGLHPHRAAAGDGAPVHAARGATR